MGPYEEAGSPLRPSFKLEFPTSYQSINALLVGEYLIPGFSSNLFDNIQIHKILDRFSCCGCR